MARTGRPPKSIEQRKAEGTLRPSRHSQVPLASSRDTPVCPEHLQGSAREAFELLLEDLRETGTLAKADRAMLTMAAMHYGVAIEAHDMLAKSSLLITATHGARDGSEGYKVIEKNPVVQILRDALVELRQCCDALGIGPAARARLSNMGVKGAPPAATLPGVGAEPTPLHVLEGGKAKPKAKTKPKANAKPGAKRAASGA